jgi:hypothetical protein
MALSKIRNASVAGLVHLETQEATSAVADIKFGPDVFNTTYDIYRIFGRVYPDTDTVNLRFRFLDNSETDLTGTSYYRFANSSGTVSNETYGKASSTLGAAANTEFGLLFSADVWLPHVGSINYESVLVSRTARANNAQEPKEDILVNSLRYDKITTQPEGIRFFLSSGNMAKALISVFGVSEG